MEDSFIYKINLNNIDDIKKFLVVAALYKEDISVISATGKEVSAKSIMGIMSVDLSKDILVSIKTKDESVAEKFKSEIEDFMKKE